MMQETQNSGAKQRRQLAIKTLNEKFLNYDLVTEIRGDNRNTPGVVSKGANNIIRVDCTIVTFEYNESKEKMEARKVKTVKAFAESDNPIVAQDEAIYQAVNFLGILD